MGHGASANSAEGDNIAIANSLPYVRCLVILGSNSIIQILISRQKIERQHVISFPAIGRSSYRLLMASSLEHDS